MTVIIVLGLAGVVLAGCAAGITPPAPASSEPEQAAPVAYPPPEEPAEPTQPSRQLPPPDLIAGVEVWIPYPPGVEPPIGDAELVPGYGPMRDAVAELAEQLRRAEVEINIARTVVLREENIKLAQAVQVKFVEDTFVETVSIAPVGPDAVPQDSRELTARLQGPGVVIGTLLLEETNVQDDLRLLDPGAYLERARMDNQETFIELIDSAGEVVLQVPAFPDSGEEITDVPTAAIFLGTKSCLTCIWNWWVCRPCAFWEEGVDPAECERILDSLR